MAATLEGEIRDLRARFWSERDPEGRVFAPLADACRRAGDLDEASRLVSEGTERLPGYAPGHLVAARVARDRGEAQIATRAYRRVLNLDPENVEALRELAALAESEGWDPVAADLLHRIYLLEPDDGALRERLRAVKRRCLAEELEAVPGTPGEARELTGAAPEPPSAPAEPESAVPESPVPGPPAPEPAAPEAEPAVPEAAAEGEAPAPPEPAAAPSGDGEPGAGAGQAGPDVVTRTMGELYARQGHYDQAIRVFERLLERSPGDAGLRERLAELRARGEGAPASGAPAESPEPELPDQPPEEPAGETMEPVGAPEGPDQDTEFRIERPEEPLWETEGSGEEPESPPFEGADEPGAWEPDAGPGSGEPDPTETLAREWSTGPDETGELSTPFAWHEGGGETAEGVSGPTISEHFRRLLEWTPPEPGPGSGEDVGSGGGTDSAFPDEGDGSGSDEAGAGETDTPRSRDPDFRHWLEGLDE